MAFCHFFFKTNVFCVATQAKHEDHLHHTRALRHTRALCRPQDEHSRRLLQRVHFLVFLLSRTHFIFLRRDSSCMNFAIRFMTLVQHNFSILSSLSRLQSFLSLLRKWNMTIYKVENGAVEKTEEIRQYTLNKTSETSVTGFYVKDDDSVLVKMYATSSVIILFCSHQFCLSYCDCLLHLQSSFSHTLRMLLFPLFFLICLLHSSSVIRHPSFITHHSSFLLFPLFFFSEVDDAGKSGSWFEGAPGDSDENFKKVFDFALTNLTNSIWYAAGKFGKESYFEVEIPHLNAPVMTVKISTPGQQKVVFRSPFLLL